MKNEKYGKRKHKALHPKGPEFFPLDYPSMGQCVALSLAQKFHLMNLHAFSLGEELPDFELGRVFTFLLVHHENAVDQHWVILRDCHSGRCSDPFHFHPIISVSMN